MFVHYTELCIEMMFTCSLVFYSRYKLHTMILLLLVINRNAVDAAPRGLLIDLLLCITHHAVVCVNCNRRIKCMGHAVVNCQNR